MTDTDRRCPSDVLDRTDVCDGYSAHSLIVHVDAGAALYHPACSRGCALDVKASGGSEATARALAPRDHPWGWGPCGHTPETTILDVYGDDLPTWAYTPARR